MAEQLRQARIDETTAKRRIDSWWFAHLLRAEMHDLGLMPSRFPVECEEIRIAAETEVLRLVLHVDDAAMNATRRKSEVEARILLEQRQYVST